MFLYIVSPFTVFLFLYSLALSSHSLSLVFCHPSASEPAVPVAIWMIWSKWERGNSLAVYLRASGTCGALTLFYKKKNIKSHIHLLRSTAAQRVKVHPVHLVLGSSPQSGCEPLGLWYQQHSRKGGFLNQDMTAMDYKDQQVTVKYGHKGHAVHCSMCTLTHSVMNFESIGDQPGAGHSWCAYPGEMSSVFWFHQRFMEILLNSITRTTRGRREGKCVLWYMSKPEWGNVLKKEQLETDILLSSKVKALVLNTRGWYKWENQ